MKTFRFIILLALSSFMAISCSEEYDDSELWDKVNSLDDRITSIEEQIESMNKNIGNLEEIVDALKIGYTSLKFLIFPMGMLLPFQMVHK